MKIRYIKYILLLFSFLAIQTVCAQEQDDDGSWSTGGGGGDDDTGFEMVHPGVEISDGGGHDDSTEDNSGELNGGSDQEGGNDDGGGGSSSSGGTSTGTGTTTGDSSGSGDGSSSEPTISYIPVEVRVLLGDIRFYNGIPRTESINLPWNHNIQPNGFVVLNNGNIGGTYQLGGLELVNGEVVYTTVTVTADYPGKSGIYDVVLCVEQSFQDTLDGYHFSGDIPYNPVDPEDNPFDTGGFYDATYEEENDSEECTGDCVQPFDEIVAELQNGISLIQGIVLQDPPDQKKYVFSENDSFVNKQVEKNATKQFEEQGFNNCTSSSLGFVGQWILRNGLTENQVLLKNLQLNGTDVAGVLKKGQDPVQNKQMIESLYNTQTFTTFKEAIDDRKVVMTDVFSGNIIEPDPTDPEKTVTVAVYHAVAVVGYTTDFEIVFFDPAKGNFQVAPEEYLNKNYAIVLKSTKTN